MRLRAAKGERALRWLPAWRAERLADRVVDHVHYGLLRDEWLRLRDL